MVDISRRFCALVLVFVVWFAAFQQSDVNAADREVNFAREVLPILSDKCFACHGPDSDAEVDLRLDTHAEATRDRDGVRAIHPNDPKQSELLARITSDIAPMPPEDADKQLTEKEREILKRWVLQGGDYATHWAFVPPKKVAIGDETGSAAIDAYVQRQLKENNLEFAPASEKATLARRASLVLTGLPPSPEHLDKFLNDPSAEAFAKFVDALLASPQYGEHQARYWLDAIRYGDTHGLHLDNRRGIYPYRDWVIHAFNKNLPLDDFITWQLAGDLLPNPTLEQQVATGFVRMNPTTAEGGAIPEEFQAKNNFDRVETLGTVFLGMSLTCARCHSHKYDPISQTEYYQLFAFFNSTAEHSMDGNKYEYAPVIKAPSNVAAWEKWNDLVSQRDDLLTKANELAGQQDDEFSKTWSDADLNAQLKLVAEGAGPFADSELAKAAAQLKQSIEQMEKEFSTTLVAKELDQPRETRSLMRGEYNMPTGDPLSPGVIEAIGPLPEGAPLNRLGLAQWLTSPNHPLVARVMVNRMWQRVFGYGLVRTPEDFGLQGQQPTHPELLDWLAVELQESGWDLKHMLRLMVMTKTFQQSSKWRDGVDDPQNQLLARGPSFRLDAEVIRDVGLWASGLLDAHMGGEGVKPYQPEGLWSALMHPASNTKKYEPDNDGRQYRRSLYVYWKRTSPHPMMTLFDAPSRESSCVRRSRTNTPLQSLGLLNERQRMEMARSLAQRLIRERDGDQQRLKLLFELIASRAPNEKEASVCTNLLNSMRERYTATPDDAAQLLSVGQAPVAENMNNAEVAAWTQLASTLLASDLAIMLY